MKSARYYQRKAAQLKECGHWLMADEMERMGRKKRNAERRDKHRRKGGER
jgi:hypothetical protein